MKLPLPNIDYSKYIDDIVGERKKGKNKTYFTRYRDTWKARNAEYDASGGNPESIKKCPKTTGHKDKFVNLYERRSGAHHIEIHKIRKHALSLCPLCGEEGRPNTLDHYLPKSIFPEFALSPCNLFPLCDSCQQQKLTKILDSRKKKIFIHPYYDDFFDEQIIKMDIYPPYSAPSGFILYPNPSFDATQRALVSRQLTNLEIRDRYKDYFKNQYVRLLKLAKNMRNKKQCVKSHVESFVESPSNDSVNSWPHIFYESVLRNEHLLDHLQNGELPEFI